MTTLDPTLLPALDKIQELLSRPAPPRSIDKRQLLNSMQRMDHEMRTSHYAAVMDEPVYARVSEEECDAAFDPELQMGANDDRR